MRNVVLATEDELSEFLGEKLIKDANTTLNVTLRLRKGGFGYLKSKLPNLCGLSKTQPVILFTDLDSCECPKILIDSWFKGMEKPKGLLFRVVVREIESWVLADHKAFSEYFGISQAKLPPDPDSIFDPKATLLKLVGGSRREIKEAMIAKKGALAIQGVGYNTILGDFIRTAWSSHWAQERSKSLKRAFARINEF
ncbi:TPA: hypothetical protein RJR47_001342 [Klebsiella michiganensis]|nr:hypothetical protein [Klebsiella michiganensis]